MDTNTLPPGDTAPPPAPGFDMDAAADRLFGATAQQAPHTDFFGNETGYPTAAENTHGDALREIRTAAVERGVEPAQADADGKVFVQMFASLGLGSNESKTFAGLHNLVERQGVPDAATAAEWASEARTAVAMDFGGPEGVSQALADARTMIARNPALHAYLSRTGLGNHKSIVTLACAKARELRKAGKL